MTKETSNRWPAAIAGLALVFLAALGASLYWGITRASRVSDPAYYSRGLGYGGQLRAEQASRDWVLATSRRGRELYLEVRDATGAPLAGLHGGLRVQAADGSEASRHELSPQPVTGSYRITLPPLPAGGARAVVELRVEGALLRRSLLLMP